MKNPINKILDKSIEMKSQTLAYLSFGAVTFLSAAFLLKYYKNKQIDTPSEKTNTTKSESNTQDQEESPQSESNVTAEARDN